MIKITGNTPIPSAIRVSGSPKTVTWLSLGSTAHKIGNDAVTARAKARQTRDRPSCARISDLTRICRYSWSDSLKATGRYLSGTSSGPQARARVATGMPDSGWLSASVGSPQESLAHVARMAATHREHLPEDRHGVVAADHGELGDRADRHQMAAVNPHETVSRPFLLDVRDRHPGQVRAAVGQVQAHVVADRLDPADLRALDHPGPAADLDRDSRGCFLRCGGAALVSRQRAVQRGLQPGPGDRL